ncbi:nuclease-related domain-containing protein [Aerococcaceae bacterium WGS1372]
MEKPFYLEYLEILERRINLPEESKRRLWAQRVGYEGHRAFDELLVEYCPKDWEILHNLNFNHPVGKTQIDTLLINSQAIYHFEVKNLVQPAEYRDGEWYNQATGRRFRNYFTQMNRQRELLGHILESLDIRAPIISRLVLINDQDTVTFTEDMQEHYLKRWQIKQFLENIRQLGTMTSKRKLINPAEAARRIVELTIEEFERDQYPEANLIHEARKGMLCVNCKTNLVGSQSRYLVKCARCGKVESREAAVMRTICEVGVINYEKDLTARMVNDLIGEPSMARYIRRKLADYFEVKGRGRGTSYNNPKASLKKAFPHLKFRYD